MFIVDIILVDAIEILTAKEGKREAWYTKLQCLLYHYLLLLGRMACMEMRQTAVLPGGGGRVIGG